MVFLQICSVGVTGAVGRSRLHGAMAFDPHDSAHMFYPFCLQALADPLDLGKQQ